MTIPTSTYRLQFRNGMTFERAEKLIPYLRSMGISHLYGSPIMTAVSGSTHGYDVTNCNEIDPTLGGRSGFDRLSNKLKKAGLSLIVDIVPNHMAASIENAWWADVLRHGNKSRFANHFDIDWSQKLTLPILGKSFGQALRAGEVRLAIDDKNNPSLAYFGTALPLAPDTIADIADPVDFNAIEAVHNRQYWQLTHWKTAARHLTYRRFFEVTGLVGLKIENPEVFDDSHRLILELVATGQVEGIRLDHIDGLADPESYLNSLRQAVGPDFYIIAEKILGANEQLPAEWPISGTTGYEFVTALSDLLVDSDGAQVLRSRYADLCPDSGDFDAEIRASKALMVDRNFEGETRGLVKIAMRASHDLTEEEVAHAIRELLIAFPIYRTYGGKDALGPRDATVLHRAVERARKYVADPRALEWLASVLDDGSQAELRKRFQQLSGPIMAKAIEDTLFYRLNAIVALNEVGAEPNKAPAGVEAFHALMEARLHNQPDGLSATSTHDTKRGEDARARLYAISEAPGLWSEAVKRWSFMNRELKSEGGEEAIPSADLQWMLFQSLAGCWPSAGYKRDQLTDRFVSYAEKAVREAKLSTNWNEPDIDFEDAVKRYAAGLTSLSVEFQKDFATVLEPFIVAGNVNSLAQTLIKLTAPGVPDIYQGSEVGDYSLVDPDNRQPVDLSKLMSGPDTQYDGGFGHLKQRITQIGLHLRQKYPTLFSRGKYLPLTVSGSKSKHLIAFARVEGSENFAVTIASRLMFGEVAPGSYAATAEFWGNTSIALPRGLDNGTMHDLIGGRGLQSDNVRVSDILVSSPVALMVRGYGLSASRSYPGADSLLFSRL